MRLISLQAHQRHPTLAELKVVESDFVHYIFAWPERIDSLNCGLVKFSAASSAAWYSAARAISSGVAAANSPSSTSNPSPASSAGHAQQICLGRVQILRVARVGDPHRLALAQHAGEPVDLAQQVVKPLRVVGLGKQKLLLPAAVVARGHRNRLAVARLQKLKLAHSRPSCAPRCRRRSLRRAAPSPAQSRQRSA